MKDFGTLDAQYAEMFFSGRALKKEQELRETFCKAYMHINLEESDLSKFSDRAPRSVEMPDADAEFVEDASIEDDLLWDDDYEDVLIETFGEIPLVYNNPKLSNEILLGNLGHLADDQLDRMFGQVNRKRIRRINKFARENLKPFTLKDLSKADYNKIHRELYINFDITKVQLSQIELPPLDYKHRLIQKLVDIYYRKNENTMLDIYDSLPDDLHGMIKTFFALKKMRNVIAKDSGLDYNTVDRALARIWKVVLRQEIIDRKDLRWSQIEDWMFTTTLLAVMMKREKQREQSKQSYGDKWFRYDPGQWNGWNFDSIDCVDRKWRGYLRYGNAPREFTFKDRIPFYVTDSVFRSLRHIIEEKENPWIDF